MTQKTTTKSRTARAGSHQDDACASGAARKPSKLDQIEALLRREGGASIAEMIVETGWQKHSLRGAMAGSLKKRGLVITSAKLDGERRYRAAAA
jgi:hypothetical protein